MVYLDTSFVLPLFIREASSEKVATLLQQVSPEELAVSLWTKTEFVSALARRVRMGDISTETATSAIIRFTQVLEESCEVLIPNAQDFEIATELLQNFHTGLRAGDALHLALVLNYQADSLYTLDNGLAKVAADLKITIKMLN